MKKSTGVILVLIIVLLLGAIGTGGYLYWKGQQRIGELENKISTIHGNSNGNNETSAKYEELTADSLRDGDSLFVTNVIKNNDNTYTLQGVVYTEYTLSRGELEEIVKKGTMKLDGESYTVEDGTAVDTYMLCDKNGNTHYYIRKNEDSLRYTIIRGAQVSLTQKKTDTYRQITVDKDVKCYEVYFEEVEKTVEEQFKDYTSLVAPDSTHPTPSYTFEFKNGKCTKVYVDNGI